jgi:hypothetical protein
MGGEENGIQPRAESGGSQHESSQTRSEFEEDLVRQPGIGGGAERVGHIPMVCMIWMQRLCWKGSNR